MGLAQHRARSAQWETRGGVQDSRRRAEKHTGQVFRPTFGGSWPNSGGFGQNQDNIGQNQDNIGQNQDNIGQNQDNICQNQDNICCHRRACLRERAGVRRAPEATRFASYVAKDGTHTKGEVRLEGQERFSSRVVVQRRGQDNIVGNQDNIGQNQDNIGQNQDNNVVLVLANVVLVLANVVLIFYKVVLTPALHHTAG
jgi:hypothetical protein